MDDVDIKKMYDPSVTCQFANHFTVISGDDDVIIGLGRVNPFGPPDFDHRIHLTVRGARALAQTLLDALDDAGAGDAAVGTGGSQG